MEIQVSVHDWLQLPMEVRLKLCQVFAIRKSQGSLVEGNVVKSDGHTYQDLQAITVEKMQTFLEQPEVTDFVQLFNSCTEKVVAQLEAEKPVVQKLDPTQVLLDEWASRLSHMLLQAKNLGLEDAFKTLISKLILHEPAPKEVKQEGTPSRGAKTKKAGN